MSIYISSYILVCLNALASLTTNSSSKSKLFWYFSILILISINTIKWNVGGDWWVYYDYTLLTKSRGLFDSLIISEPGFMLLTWINSRLGFDLPGINFFASIIFFLGLQKLIKNEKGKWLSLLITIPIIYFIIFQGYLRQGIALGFILLSIGSLKENKNLYFLFYVFVAFLFHRSAIFCFFFILHDFYILRRFFSKFIFLCLFVLFLYFLYLFIPIINLEINNLLKRLSGDIYHYYTHKIRISTGAIPRAIINSLPAFLFFLFYDKFSRYKDFSIYFTLSLITLLLFILSFFFSTIADRLSIYTVALQIVIYPRFINLIDNNSIKLSLILLIIISYFFMLIFYFAFGENSTQYFPYEIYFTRDLPNSCHVLPYEICK